MVENDPRPRDPKVQQDIEDTIRKIKEEGLDKAPVPPSATDQNVQKDIDEAVKEIDKTGNIEVKPYQARERMFQDAGERRPSFTYERPRGEKIEPEKFERLLGFIQSAFKLRSDELLNKWIQDHAQEVQRRFYRTDLSETERDILLKDSLVRQEFRRDLAYNKLSAIHEALKDSEGRPPVPSVLLSFVILEQAQRDLEQRFSATPSHPGLIEGRHNILEAQEALYGSIYKRDVPLEQAKIQQAEATALADPDVEHLFQESIARANSHPRLQAEAAETYNNLIEPWQISVFRQRGYTMELIGGRFNRFGGEKRVGVFDKNIDKELDKETILKEYEQNEKKRLSKEIIKRYIEKQKREFFSSQEFLQEGMIEQITADLERETEAQIMVKENIIKRKAQDPAVGKRNEESLKRQGGDDVVRMLSEVLEGGQYESFYKNFKGTEEDFKTFLAYTRRPEDYLTRLSPKRKRAFMQELKKGKKLGFFDWLISVVNIIYELEQ